MTTMHAMPLPPHDHAAEQSVLGGLMIQPAALAKISDWLSDTDFHRAAHRTIYRAIVALAESSRAVDGITVSDWLGENAADSEIGIEYLFELANSTPSAANIVAYAEIVAEKSRLRQLADAGTELATAAAGGRQSSTDLAAIASHKLTALASTTSRGGLQPAKIAMGQLYAEMLERYSAGQGMLGLPTPWLEINKLTSGLRKNTLYVIGARPSMGKSVLAGQLAYFTALRGHRAAFFAVEGTAVELLARSIASLANIPYSWVEHPNDKDPDAEQYWPRQTRAITDLRAAPLMIDDAADITIDQLMARARRAHMQSPLELIVIDHMHDMRIDPRREARHEYGRIAQGAKTLAKELDIPVVVMAQLNRAAAQRGDSRPVMTDLRESGEIEQKADVILFLHREDYYDTPKESTHLQGVIEVIPAKGRNVRIGQTIHLQNRFDVMRMDDWEGALPQEPEPETDQRKPSKKSKGYQG